MSKVEFDSQYEYTRNQPFQPKGRGMIGWLVEKEFAKDEKTATYILLGIIAVLIIIIFIALGTLGGGSDASQLQPDPDSF